MHNEVRKTAFDRDVFRIIGSSDHELARNLRIEQLRLVLLKDDGTQIAVLTTATAERVADKRHLGEIMVPRGWQAISIYDQRPGSQLLIGSDSVDRNPTIEDAIAGLRALFEREGKTSFVGSQVPDSRCYMRKTGDPAFTDVTAVIDAAEVAYLPGAKGYLARKRAQTNTLGFLSVMEAGEGSFIADAWRFVEIPGLKYVTGIQSRIARADAVMIHGVNQADQAVTMGVNLEKIAAGKIEVTADEPTPSGLLFRGMIGESVAQIQADHPVAGLQPGTNLVSVDLLPSLFGDAARQFVSQPTA